MAPRRIAVVTGTRAEYGLLKGLLACMSTGPGFEAALVVTGAHLEKKFGETWREIEADGFSIAKRVPLHIMGDGPLDIAATVGRAVIGLAQALTELKPELVVLLGDRYEILAAAEAATLCGIPIAHIHGGELTEGAIDDAFRHAITKMSHLHFATCEEYRRRIIQLGETPSCVFNVGSLGVDAIGAIALADMNELEDVTGLPLRHGYFLVTYHPSTLDQDGGLAGCQAMLVALDRFPDCAVVITGVNADPGYSSIAELLADYAVRHAGRACLIESLGQRRYLSLMKYCEAVLGNSSSGIIEAPSLHVPTINIGDRQKGRVRAASVIDCGPDADSIAAALRRALSAEYRAEIAGSASPYGGPGAAQRILEVLRTVALTGIRHKRFRDVRAECLLSA